jgi:TolB-like protein/DNA-binding winged helix-turn-helix (wHTH) protein
VSTGWNRKRIVIDDLVLDVGTRQVKRGDSLVELPKLSFELLLALARAAPNVVTADELMDEVWDGRVVSPATIAKRVELVRQALGDDSKNPRYVALVRGHGYRLLPEVHAAPAMPEDAAGAPPDDVSLPSEPSSNRWSRTLAAGAMSLVVSVLAYYIWWTPAGAPAPPRSVAVLPFVPMSDDEADGHFADGLTEELSHALANVSGLKVAGRTSAFHFKGRNDDLRDIGATLGVATVLEGSVRRDEGKLRITAQLVSTEDGFHLWSETYDRDAADLLEIQEEIALSVADTLSRGLLAADAERLANRPTTDPETYVLYLRAMELAQGGPPGLARAQPILEEVVERDPNYAPAWNLLARVNGLRIMGRHEGYPYDWNSGWRRIKDAADQALLLDPNSGEAYANLGGVAWLYEGDDVRAARFIQRAVELEPQNLEIINFANTFAQLIGRLDEAIELGVYLVERDPLCMDCRRRLARSYEFAGRLDEAEAVLLAARELGPGGYEWSLAQIHLQRGEPEAALASVRELDHHPDWRLMGEAMALHDLGDEKAFESTMAELEAIASDSSPILIAMAYAWTGPADEAFEWIDRSLEHNPTDLRTEFLRPQFNKIRDDPRWDAALRKVGRAPEQLEAIEFEVRRPGDGTSNVPDDKALG